MNKLLLRQLKKNLKINDPAQIPDELKAFVEAVADSYNHHEEEQARLERSMTLATEELEDALGKLQAQEEELRQAVEELMTINEEMERTQNKLKDANEKLKESERELENKVEMRTRELLHAKEAAERANKVKSEFLANMSHELRTPLNAILGYAQILSDSKTLDPNTRDKIKIINKSGEHLLGLINTVLDLSKIEAGKMEIVASGFDLLDLLQQIYDMFRLRAESKDLKLSFEANAAVPRYVFADEAKIRQCLINVVGNAVKFTENGGVDVNISRDEDGQTRFTIRDTGRGIPKDKIATILEPFSQIHAQLNTEGGTGLGLSITKSFVEMMGGKIGVESEQGRGSTFTITLPLEEVESIASEKDSGPPRRILGIKNGKTAKILIVDDNPVNRDVAREILAPIGFVLDETDSGAGAIHKTVSWLPDAVLMDIRMPGVNGVEATKIIRSTEAGKNVKILAVTASAFDQNREEFLNNGCDGYLAKPYKALNLLEEIAFHLGLEYEYEYFEPEFGHDSPETPASEFRIEDVLAAVTSEFLTEFENYILDGRLDELPALIDALNKPELACFSQLVRQKADDYDYDGVEKLLEKLKQSA